MRDIADTPQPDVGGARSKGESPTARPRLSGLAGTSKKIGSEYCSSSRNIEFVLSTSLYEFWFLFKDLWAFEMFYKFNYMIFKDLGLS